jgi:hypothetical protein
MHTQRTVVAHVHEGAGDVGVLVVGVDGQAHLGGVTHHADYVAAAGVLLVEVHVDVSAVEVGGSGSGGGRSGGGLGGQVRGNLQGGIGTMYR